jgi:hypothetical protein
MTEYLTAADAEAARKPTSDLVLEAIKDLTSHEQIATRETVQHITGVKLTLVDDALKTLTNKQLIARVQRGVYVLIHQHPEARIVSMTQLPDGTIKLDVGDDVYTLTPREARLVATALAGIQMQAAVIESGHQAAITNGLLSVRMHQLEREVREAMAGRRKVRAARKKETDS